MDDLLVILVFIFFAALVFGLASGIKWAIQERIWPMAWLIFVVSLLLAIIFVGAAVSADQPNISLVKSAWTCTKTAEKDETTYVKSGSVMTPITTTVQECIQYEKN